ncbi:MAG: hypothetical protein JSV36_11965 [Anaerolineae bacterium]|nr:MAG: hypothetical protein JSV36_11965 [Anaerolineae bacterium]
MSNELKAQMEAIDRSTLTPLVRRTLGSEAVEVIDWDYRQLHVGAGMISSIYRYSGKGRDGDETVPWSLILKAIRVLQGAQDPSNVVYDWKREVLAYQSGLLDNLPGGLAAPKCCGVAEQPGRGVWLWLEDVADELGAHWPLEHYGVVARQLGQFNGAYLVGEPLPSAPWLSQGWLRAYVEQAAPAIAQLRGSLEHPLVRRFLPGRIADDLLRLWAERETFLDALDRLPQTFCHLDAFRRNLFARRSPDGHVQTVAVDWAFVGIGAVGEEIVPLVQASVLILEVELTRAQELDEIVFQGYLDGLRDAGWHGDPRLVQLGYAAAGALRYFIGGAGKVVPWLLDEGRHPMAEQIFGCPIGELMDLWAERLCLYLDLVEEARGLLDILR